MDSRAGQFVPEVEWLPRTPLLALSGRKRPYTALPKAFGRAALSEQFPDRFYQPVDYEKQCWELATG
jgi:hypothetical protein